MNLTEQVSEKILESQALPDLIETIVEQALTLFDDAGAKDDFGLQYIGPTVIVFGRTNRVTWSARDGFKPDESYCTKGFLERWRTPF